MTSTGAGKKTFQFKLVLLGESSVGKSSLVQRFIKQQYQDFQESTIGGESPGCTALGSALIVCCLRRSRVPHAQDRAAGLRGQGERSQTLVKREQGMCADATFLCSSRSGTRPGRSATTRSLRCTTAVPPPPSFCTISHSW